MDVLARLGAQAIGTASTVKPIIAPLFRSPPRPALPVAETVGDLVEPMPTEAHSPASAPSLPAFERLEPLVGMTSRGDRGLPDPGGEAPTGVGLRADVDRPADVQASVEDRIGVMPPHSVAPGPLPIDSTRATAKNVPVRAVRGRPPVERQPMEKVPAKLVPRAPRETTPPQHAVRRSPAPDLLVETPRWNATMLLERLRSLGGSAPDRSTRRDAVVRVSIGRIEVRATPPPQPAPAPAPVLSPSSAPVRPERLTLADYLERKREAR